MFKRECTACKVKDNEIEYLRRLIDNLLVNKGIAPVMPQEDIPIEKEDALKEGEIRYGN